MTKATLLLFALAAALAAEAGATRANQCGTVQVFPDPTTVTVSNCDVPPCKLRKRTKIHITIRFTPDRDINRLTNNVYAVILGVPLPFPGVDGTNACNQVFNLDNTPAPCPLKRGVEYIYKSDIPVLQIYPSVNLLVHWGLREYNRLVACFEVPARIY